MGEISQTALANMIGSSQSRVAKMEACDPSVSMDLMFKAAFALGADQEKIGKFIASIAGVALTKRTAPGRKSGACKAKPKAATGPRAKPGK